MHPTVHVIHRGEPQGFYAAFNDEESNRWWNGFGTTMPNGKNTLPLTVEINVPHTGIDRRIGGVFIEHPASDHRFLAHRGKIGGGRKGISKERFFDLYSGESITARDGDRETEVFPIGGMEDDALAEHLSEFIHEVQRIKSLAVGAPKPPRGGAEFTPEFEGQRRSRLQEPITAIVRHGSVVRYLRAKLASSGLTVGNDRARDLYTIRARRMLHLFEVKTDIRPSSIYTGIGQLLVHGRSIDTRIKLYLVVPGVPTRMLRRTLTELGIAIVRYEWRSGKPALDSFPI